MPGMMTSIQSQIPLIWLALAIALAVIEIMVPAFGFIFGTLAALVTAALTAVIPIPWPLQLVVFALVLILGLVLLRPRLLAKIQSQKRPDSRSEKLIGRRGQVTQAIQPGQGMGRVLVEGEDWAARSESALPEGAPIEVKDCDGIVLIVKGV